MEPDVGHVAVGSGQAQAFRPGDMDSAPSQRLSLLGDALRLGAA